MYQSVSVAPAFFLQSLSSSSSCFTSSISGGALRPQFIIPNSFFISVFHNQSDFPMCVFKYYIFLVFWCFGGKLLFEIKNDVFLVFFVCVLCIRRGGLWW